jgi:hypothetical protein
MTCAILIAAAVLTSVSAARAQRENVRPAVLIQVTPTDFVAAPRSPLAVVQRLLSFDTNKDQRLTRDELPERMQALIARCDKSGDGALDADEIRVAVNTASSDRTRAAVRFRPSDGLPGVISDLKLSPAKREQALAILSAHKPPPNVKVGEPSGDVYKAMKLLLDDEEYENFAAAAARLSRTAQIPMGTVGGILRPLPPPPTVR